MNETWKDIPGYEDLYQVSNYGQIRRLQKRVTTKRGYTQRHNAKNKTLGVQNEYYYLWLFKANNGKKYYVHTLVALAFIGPRPDKHDIHHINQNRLDNRPCNLQYIDNHTHKREHNKGEKHSMAKITEADVILIRELYRTTSVHVIAESMSLPYHAVWAAAHRRTWKHIT